jgi:hypothetical protein
MRSFCVSTLRIFLLTWCIILTLLCRSLSHKPSHVIWRRTCYVKYMEMQGRFLWTCCVSFFLDQYLCVAQVLDIKQMCCYYYRKYKHLFLIRILVIVKYIIALIFRTDLAIISEKCQCRVYVFWLYRCNLTKYGSLPLTPMHQIFTDERKIACD